ncbi:hypothetical protein QNO07_25570 [Streptomyces sp. 549]|uniref:hypothetical protein n=1 Tax=Streptomyces sp. 549 TaxID=3049076 RepID=UPI0024C3DAB5|nr:hypothetical protein [Streptomyces sp. 549]MDK1476730.1 hypothetical protein [Streptomyces sp. 549]
MTRRGQAAPRDESAAPREEQSAHGSGQAHGAAPARDAAAPARGAADRAGDATGQAGDGTDSTSHPVPGGERGATRISEHAHQRVAAGAAGEALRRAVPGAPTGLPRAAVRIRRGGTRIKIGVVLPCPSDLGAPACG